MKPRLSENPVEWRKQAWLLAAGAGIVGIILQIRHHLTTHLFEVWMTSCVALACTAWIMPRWFRWYYRLSMKTGLVLGKWLGLALLMLIFALIITPAALIGRIAGKDPLSLRKSQSTNSYWRTARPRHSLEDLF